MISFAFWMIFASPFVFLAGIVILAVRKEKQKLGLSLVIGSIISFIIGFGICSSLRFVGFH